ncbi:MAG: DNA replication/repair protein RecF [Sphingomonas sp.]|nr:DNA replication/repair protein RecF [Sphingomonas sp.]
MTEIIRLSLTDFRNYRDLLVETGGGFVLLSGPNGAGKTNILEAVSLLAPGRGLRQVPIADMARSDGPGGFSVAARLGDSSEIGTGTNVLAPDRRQVRINGAPAAVNSLAERLSVLWLTPAMDRLFTESAGGRRRFLDRLTLALDPAHARHAARYEAAMRARNKLLSEPGPPDAGWLSALEAQMAEHGTALAEARSRTVEALEAAGSAEIPGDFPRAGLELAGWDSKADLAETLRLNRPRDAAAGRTTEGPHRHDLLVTHAAKGQPASRSSTGEQKALLLGLVLAHAELVAARRGSSPVLLLDEVAAHLDPGRRAALFARLEGRGQIWLTATEAMLFDGIARADRFHVEAGTLTRL